MMLVTYKNYTKMRSQQNKIKVAWYKNVKIMKAAGIYKI